VATALFTQNMTLKLSLISRSSIIRIRDLNHSVGSFEDVECYTCFYDFIHEGSIRSFIIFIVYSKYILDTVEAH